MQPAFINCEEIDQNLIQRNLVPQCVLKKKAPYEAKFSKMHEDIGLPWVHMMIEEVTVSGTEGIVEAVENTDAMQDIGNCIAEGMQLLGHFCPTRAAAFRSQFVTLYTARNAKSIFHQEHPFRGGCTCNMYTYPFKVQYTDMEYRSFLEQVHGDLFTFNRIEHVMRYVSCTTESSGGNISVKYRYAFDSCGFGDPEGIPPCPIFTELPPWELYNYVYLLGLMKRKRAQIAQVVPGIVLLEKPLLRHLFCAHDFEGNAQYDAIMQSIEQGVPPLVVPVGGCDWLDAHTEYENLLFFIQGFAEGPKQFPPVYFYDSVAGNRYMMVFYGLCEPERPLVRELPTLLSDFTCIPRFTLVPLLAAMMRYAKEFDRPPTGMFSHADVVCTETIVLSSDDDDDDDDDAAAVIDLTVLGKRRFVFDVDHVPKKHRGAQ